MNENTNVCHLSRSLSSVEICENPPEGLHVSDVHAGTNNTTSAVKSTAHVIQAKTFNRLSVKRIKEILITLMLGMSVFVLFGTVGGLSSGLMSFGQAVIFGAIGIVGMIQAAVKLSGRRE